MAGPRPGWLVALSAALVCRSAWLPLTTSFIRAADVQRGSRTFGSITLPSRFGTGQLIVLLSSVLIVAGAMVARSLSPSSRGHHRTGPVVGDRDTHLVHYRLNVHSPVVAGYGFYLGAVFGVASVLCSVWALIAVFLGGRRIRRL